MAEQGSPPGPTPEHLRMLQAQHAQLQRAARDADELRQETERLRRDGAEQLQLRLQAEAQLQEANRHRQAAEQHAMAAQQHAVQQQQQLQHQQQQLQQAQQQLAARDAELDITRRHVTGDLGLPDLSLLGRAQAVASFARQRQRSRSPSSRVMASQEGGFLFAMPGPHRVHADEALAGGDAPGAHFARHDQPIAVEGVAGMAPGTSTGHHSALYGPHSHGVVFDIGAGQPSQEVLHARLARRAQAEARAHARAINPWAHPPPFLGFMPTPREPITDFMRSAPPAPPVLEESNRGLRERADHVQQATFQNTALGAVQAVMQYAAGGPNPGCAMPLQTLGQKPASMQTTFREWESASEQVGREMPQSEAPHSGFGQRSSTLPYQQPHNIQGMAARLMTLTDFPQRAPLVKQQAWLDQAETAAKRVAGLVSASAPMTDGGALVMNATIGHAVISRLPMSLQRQLEGLVQENNWGWLFYTIRQLLGINQDLVAKVALNSLSSGAIRMSSLDHNVMQYKNELDAEMSRAGVLETTPMAIQLQWFQRGLHSALKPLCASNRGEPWQSVKELAKHASDVQLQLQAEREEAQAQAQAQYARTQATKSWNKPRSFSAPRKQEGSISAGPSRAPRPVAAAVQPEQRGQKRSATPQGRGHNHRGHDGPRGQGPRAPGPQRSRMADAMFQVQQGNVDPNGDFAGAPHLKNREAKRRMELGLCFFCKKPTDTADHVTAGPRGKSIIKCPTPDARL